MRYVDPHNSQALIDPANEAYWMGPRPEVGNTSGGTDLYIGGVEHAVLHLLYSRFWHKVLFDLGLSLPLSLTTSCSTRVMCRPTPTRTSAASSARR